MDYQSLIVWQRAMDLCDEIYRITEAFPKRELFRLVAQLRASALSVPSNIAEGEGRMTKGEKRQFLGHARGSLYEVETELLVARRVGYAPVQRPFELVAEVKRLLHSYIAYVERQ